MGNTEQTQHQQHYSEHNTKRISNHRYVLEIQDRQIILDYQNKIKLTIGDILSFPAGGFEGLHLWDSNIELARYVLTNRDIFAGKSVIQLLSGTGIGAITVKKFTKASKIAATDKSQQVTINIGKNCQKNNINQGMIVACISWSDYKQFKTKFDYVIGADILQNGCSVQQLINSLDRLLNVGGKAIFVIPYKNQQNSTNQFIKLLDNNVFSLKRQKLIDQIYMQSPLLNQVLGYQQFKQISEGVFHVYIIQKIKQTHSQATIRHKTNIQKSQATKPIKRKNTQPKKQSNLPTNQPAIQVKNQVISHPTEQQQRCNQQRIKRQLDIIKINKQEDKPAYIRNKKKSITQMIAQSQQHNIPKQGQRKICNKYQVQIVKKQHDLYNQPIKKSQFDKNSYNKTKQNQHKGDI